MSELTGFDFVSVFAVRSGMQPSLSTRVDHYTDGVKSFDLAKLSRCNGEDK